MLSSCPVKVQSIRTQSYTAYYWLSLYHSGNQMCMQAWPWAFGDLQIHTGRACLQKQPCSLYIAMQMVKKKFAQALFYCRAQSGILCSYLSLGWCHDCDFTLAHTQDHFFWFDGGVEDTGDSLIQYLANRLQLGTTLMISIAADWWLHIFIAVVNTT